MFCTKCGSSNPDTGSFCCNCGAVLLKAKEATTPIESTIKTTSSVEFREGQVGRDSADDLDLSQSYKNGFKNIEVIGSVGLLISFFLPWVSIGGLMTFNGYQIPNAVSALLRMGQALVSAFGQSGTKDALSIDTWYLQLVYVSPLLAVFTLVLAFLKKNTLWVGLSSGGVFLTLLVLGAAKSYPIDAKVFDALSIGFYLSVLSALLCVCGIARTGKKYIPAYVVSGSIILIIVIILLSQKLKTPSSPANIDPPVGAPPIEKILANAVSKADEAAAKETQENLDRIMARFNHTENPTAKNGTTPAATVQAESAQILTFTATDPTRVKIVQDLDGTVLLNVALARGESKSVKKQGKLLITVELGKNLRMEVNGRNYAVPLEGYGRFALD